ncbi:LacI family DNA-binding transcriptional regulator [Virgibacillus pantothenticus]|uniref:LacI family transcriptional regulator n=1 Tax=Virgibacillus pantothenticus TaxID=1473 RepID=A0A0L0QUH6_VIRPA|nr:LacI family DNA-binding transcriptional regulator [Virgibacillus pantothenticus]KNE22340.1 LacI family transcriptional regulator [Virgibacillus pantothenticus]MED3735526.1 LacI family DNA-binding transcriptional regulator [Virgibacillus pantothenticus]QTY16798.1 LacI family DNA-binding transcriptional regulator [Virgibacillus pantothenticus]SIS87021.1 transcriptional regulator, LacI family [Virgibacillus pantothenticus]
MATIKDVAKLAGVAISTASYALNNSNKVSQATKEKVEAAAKSLNYKKNGFASDLKRTKTNTIALILSDLSGPFYSELIQGVQDVTTANGFDLIACSSIGGANSTATKFLQEKRVDGAIILAHNISDEVTLQSARKGFPLVVLDRKLDSDFVYNIEVDNTHGGYLATEHLIQNGHREIAYVSGPYNSHDNNLRFQGYMNALNDHGIAYQPKWKIIGDFTREGGYRTTKMLIAQRKFPHAIFYSNDEMAIGGLEALRENNISVPDDISIIGFDDIQLAEYVSPPLSTIKQPKYEAGSLAVHVIFQLLAGEKVDHHYTLSTELVKRQSVKQRKLPEPIT